MIIGWNQQEEEEDEDEEEQQLAVLLSSIYQSLCSYQLFFVENRSTHEHSILTAKMSKAKQTE